MNYQIKKVEFEISNFTIASSNIINSNLLIHYNKAYSIYKIINYIGKGTIGQVYLLESQKDLSVCVIKISNSNCSEDLIDEVEFLRINFVKYNITHPSYPLFCGYFRNLKGFGVIYPYFGFYNLEKIKLINYKINFTNNKQIIKQIINQQIQLKNIIHCDLKPSNIVVDVLDNNIFATIIDFGLARENTTITNVISTIYITSPESLLTLFNFSECLINDKDLKLDKHDYFGLFSIILNLFINKSFWELFSKYLTDIGFYNEFLHKHNSSVIFVYTWFRFSYEDKSHIINKSLLNIINKIEVMFPNITSKKFQDLDNFFDNYIRTYIDFDTINKSNLNDLKDFIKQILQFDYVARTDLDELLKHKFLN
jgi:serine/threonine protein kinase